MNRLKRWRRTEMAIGSDRRFVARRTKSSNGGENSEERRRGSSNSSGRGNAEREGSGTLGSRARQCACETRLARSCSALTLVWCL
ncbi:hypothetical protein U1Q18_000390 [Sarracenia purpurea var. burkii]